MTGRLAIVFLSSLQVLGIAGRFEGVNFSTNASKKRGKVRNQRIRHPGGGDHTTGADADTMRWRAE
jgi:hypothetical protein